MQEILKIAQEAALEAGREILNIYQSNDFSLELKNDHSPLTKADRASHDCILSHLRHTSLPVLSEEGRSIPYEERKHWSRFWLIDPLDGTKEFIKRNGEFTVNIALIERGQPVLGVVYVPTTDKLYFGSTGFGAFLQQGEELKELKPRKNLVKLADIKHISNITVVASRSHLNAETEKFILTLNQPRMISMGSSLKFLLLAEGMAQVYPRFAPTMEWDTAAAHGILNALQYNVFAYPELTPLQYNKQDLLNPSFICY